MGAACLRTADGEADVARGSRGDNLEGHGSGVLGHHRPIPISCAIMETLKDLVGLGRDELAAEMKAMGAEPFRARQLWHWIYNRGATDIAAMTSLSKSFRAELATRYRVARPAVARVLSSGDSTRKRLLRVPDAQ